MPQIFLARRALTVRDRREDLNKLKEEKDHRHEIQIEQDGDDELLVTDSTALGS